MSEFDREVVLGVDIHLDTHVGAVVDDPGAEEITATTTMTTTEIMTTEITSAATEPKSERSR